MRKLKEALSEHKNAHDPAELGFQLGPLRILGVLEEVFVDGVLIRAEDGGAFVVPFDKPDMFIFPGDPEKAAEIERRRAAHKPLLVPGGPVPGQGGSA